MSMFDKNLECCGADFRSNNISYVGVLTLNANLLILNVLLFFPLFLLKRLVPAWYVTNRRLLGINIQVINSLNIFSRLKCQLAGILFKLSPFLSGFTFKYFNICFVFTSYFLILWSLYAIF